MTWFRRVLLQLDRVAPLCFGCCVWVGDNGRMGVCGSSQTPLPQQPSSQHSPPSSESSSEPLAGRYLEPGRHKTTGIVTIVTARESREDGAAAVVRFHDDAAGTLAVAEQVLELRQQLHDIACCACDFSLRNVIEVRQHWRSARVSFGARDGSTCELQFLSRHHQQELLSELLCHYIHRGCRVQQEPAPSEPPMAVEDQTPTFLSAPPDWMLCCLKCRQWFTHWIIDSNSQQLLLYRSRRGPPTSQQLQLVKQVFQLSLFPTLLPMDVWTIVVAYWVH